MSTEKKSQVLAALSGIIDPDLGRDIVSLGFIRNLTVSENGDVAFEIHLTTPACPVKDEFKKEAFSAVKKLDWVREIDISLLSSKPQQGLVPMSKGLEHVSAIVAVASCKGGVGKSTVAVNLAYSLALSGAKVGIFDADIYGPSLPTMVSVEDPQLLTDGHFISPLENRGVKLMSFGYIEQAKANSPAMMRGPMVSQVINQLLTQTQWGELDYLIVDMPPGTGDVQLTLAQLIPITASVMVTTPQMISFVDVIKGIYMFDSLKVPTIAVVENMSYFLCDACDKKHTIYGKGALEKLVREFGFKTTFEFPVTAPVSQAGDSGTPIVISEPKSIVATLFQKLADSVAREVSKIQYGKNLKPVIEWVEGKGILIKTEEKNDTVIQCFDLRQRCRCAHCVEEFTGNILVQSVATSKKITPNAIRLVGNYAVGIEWSDGHHSLYPYEFLIGTYLG